MWFTQRGLLVLRILPKALWLAVPGARAPFLITSGHVSMYIVFVSRGSYGEKKPNASMWVVLHGFWKPAAPSDRKLQSLGKGFTKHGFPFGWLPQRANGSGDLHVAGLQGAVLAEILVRE